MDFIVKFIPIYEDKLKKLLSASIKNTEKIKDIYSQEEREAEDQYQYYQEDEGGVIFDGNYQEDEVGVISNEYSLFNLLLPFISSLLKNQVLSKFGNDNYKDHAYFFDDHLRNFMKDLSDLNSEKAIKARDNYYNSAACADMNMKKFIIFKLYKLYLQYEFLNTHQKEIKIYYPIGMKGEKIDIDVAKKMEELIDSFRYYLKQLPEIVKKEKIIHGSLQLRLVACEVLNLEQNGMHIDNIYSLMGDIPSLLRMLDIVNVYLSKMEVLKEKEESEGKNILEVLKEKLENAIKNLLYAENTKIDKNTLVVLEKNDREERYEENRIKIASLFSKNDIEIGNIGKKCDFEEKEKPKEVNLNIEKSSIFIRFIKSKAIRSLIVSSGAFCGLVRLFDKYKFCQNNYKIHTCVALSLLIGGAAYWGFSKFESRPRE